MIARITTPASLQETLNYHEYKVRRGVAACIAENHFPYPVHLMNFYHKLDWFRQRDELNTRATTKIIHISLNFDPSESFTNERLIEIATDYMQCMGFEDQPYLVYRHHDAGHPHVHIMATLIRADGSRIPTHNIARELSEPARRAIEERYALVRAEGRQTKMVNTPQTIKAIYGKTEIKRGIANVLLQVLNVYNYTSLAQLNAVLKGFGVMADRGGKESFTYAKGGLLYRMLDAHGNSAGVPIKASTISGKPTLRYLETKFEQNKCQRELPRLALQNALDRALAQRPSTLNDLKSLLQNQKITVVLRQNENGRVYGITFIDHQNRAVFNGSEIGKAYSIAGLNQLLDKGYAVRRANEPLEAPSLTDLLMLTPSMETYTPNQLQKKRKKRKHQQ